MADRRLAALSVLAGVGDAAAGEWWETGDIAVHLRRRLSIDEALQVGPVVDVRSTAEGQQRFSAVQRYCPPDMPLQ